MDDRNYCIILAGGVGSKLWPISCSEKPKQFLDLFNLGRTMLQMTYDRYSKVVPADNIYISTYKGYVDTVREQLPEIDPKHIVAEPLQINTVPATALTMIDIMGRNPKANVISAPADHIIYDMVAFEEQMKKGLDFVDETGNFVAIGIKPTRPATSYGYLQVGEESKDGFMCLKSFTEKPNSEFARVFCESGEFYWNTGIFIWNVNMMLHAMEQDYPEFNKLASLVNGSIVAEDASRVLEDQYSRIRFQSIDLLILEHSENVYVAPCDFGWADVGTWKNFYDLRQKDIDRNVVVNAKNILYDCKDNLLYTSSDKVVALQGLEGYVVVENDKVLMICKKDDPALVRRIMNDVKLKFGDDVM